jgi:hypothetical protein
VRAVADALRGEDSLSSEIAARAEPVCAAVDVVDDAALVVVALVLAVLASVVGGMLLVGAVVGVVVASVARWPWPP